MGLSHKQQHAAARASAHEPSGIFDVQRWDPIAEILVTHRIQDVEPVLEENKRILRNAEEGNGGYTQDRSMQYVAQIPTILLEKWLREEHIKYWEPEGWAKVIEKLDDTDYKFLRTGPGHIGKRPTTTVPVTPPANELLVVKG